MTPLRKGYFHFIYGKIFTTAVVRLTVDDIHIKSFGYIKKVIHSIMYDRAFGLSKIVADRKKLNCFQSSFRRKYITLGKLVAKVISNIRLIRKPLTESNEPKYPWILMTDEVMHAVFP